MHPIPFQLWWRHIKTNITNNSGNYNITDLSLYKDRMMKDRFVNSYTTRGTSKEYQMVTMQVIHSDPQ